MFFPLCVTFSEDYFKHVTSGGFDLHRDSDAAVVCWRLENGRWEAWNHRMSWESHVQSTQQVFKTTKRSAAHKALRSWDSNGNRNSPASWKHISDSLFRCPSPTLWDVHRFLVVVITLFMARCKGSVLDTLACRNLLIGLRRRVSPAVGQAAPNSRGKMWIGPLQREGVFFSWTSHMLLRFVATSPFNSRKESVEVLYQALSHWQSQ